MPTDTLIRWIAPALLAGGLGIGALAPAPAHASDDLVRVITDVADVVLRGTTSPQYYDTHRRGDHRVTYDRYGRPVYHRDARADHRAYARGAAYSRHHDNRQRNTRCDSRGRCTVHYYDPRADRRNRR